MLDEYDIVLIDCPPSLGVLTINGLTAAEAVIVPMQCEALSHRGVGQLLETIEDVRQFANEKLRVLGVIPTMFDSRTTLARQVLSEVGERYGLPVFDPPVPKSVRFAEAPGFGRSVLQHAPASPGAVAYRTLSTRVTTRCRAPDVAAARATRPPTRSASGRSTGCLRGRAAGSGERGGNTIALPAGKRALFSGARQIGTASSPPRETRWPSGAPHRRVRAVPPDLACRRAGPADLPVPARILAGHGRFDHRMTCPSCRKRAWCSVTLRRA